MIAFHDDLADPNNADPIARESTRVTCAAVSGAQTTLDPKQMRDWTPNSKYGAHAFGIVWDAKQKLSSFDMFYAERERILTWIKQYCPTSWSAATTRPSASSTPRLLISAKTRRTLPIRPTSA